MKNLIILICLLSLSSCALKPIVPYDNTEKVLLGLAVGGQVFDYTSSQSVFDRGCVEKNPLFGEDPNDGVFLASKVGISLMSYFVANNITDRTTRKLFLGGVSVVGVGAGVWNTSLDCK